MSQTLTCTVAIIAPGEMGSAVARALIGLGVRVITSLEGRSEKSRERALAAGVEPVASDEAIVEQADFVLSIVPPSQAVGVARRFQPVLAAAGRRLAYVDCNAVSPDTANEIAELLAGTPCIVLDAVLFGGPTSMKPGVILHVSGSGAGELAALSGPGLKVHVIEGPIGAASALKLCFAGINKGYIALGAAMFSMALRAGCAPSLVQQLAESHGGVLDYITRAVPPMLPKAHRWDGEMTEIAQFLGSERAMADIFDSMGVYYREIGAREAKGHDAETTGERDAELVALTALLAHVRADRQSA